MIPVTRKLIDNVVSSASYKTAVARNQVGQEIYSWPGGIQECLRITKLMMQTSRVRRRFLFGGVMIVGCPQNWIVQIHQMFQQSGWVAARNLLLMLLAQNYGLDNLRLYGMDYMTMIQVPGRPNMFFMHNPYVESN